MGELLFYGLFILVGAGMGAAAGWWLRQTSETDPSEPTPAAVPEPEVSQAEPEEEADFATVEKMMARLHQLTASVAADVGEHNTRVEAINAELTANSHSQVSVISVVEKLIECNEQMRNRLTSAETRLEEQADQIEAHLRDAHTDSLTKLFNRRAFDDEIRAREEEFLRENRPACLMLIDVDHFKKINDTYGHQAGDQVLCGVASILRDQLPDSAIVCRYGGEEFAAIFPGFELEAACALTERARKAVQAETFEFDGLDIRVTVSAGLAKLQDEVDSVELLKRADQALYVSKQSGRNCGHWHDGQECHRIEMSDAQITAKAEAASEPVAAGSAVKANVEEATTVAPTPNAAASNTPAAPEVEPGLSELSVLLQQLDECLERQESGGPQSSLMFVGVDSPQELVEEFGAQAGQVVSAAIAQFLKAAMRESDVAARYDESVFAMLLPQAELKSAADIAERLRKAVQRCRLPAAGGTLQFTVSLGAAESQQSDSSQELLNRADAMLQQARQQGGNCGCGFDQQDALAAV